MNNAEKNTYAKQQLTNTLIKMLEDKPIESVTIKELCDAAMVGRASFYRNFESKEAVIREYASILIKSWGKEFENDPTSTPLTFFDSLFTHFVQHKSFYSILHEQNMSQIILDTIKSAMGITVEISNKEAYGRAFLAYGIYGLIEEWIGRGMIETPAQVNQIIAENAQMQ